MDLSDVVRNLGDFTRDAILITEAEPFDEPGPRIVWCNRAFTEATGYALDEIVGRTPRILQGPETCPEARARLRTALESWSEVRVELKNYKKCGEPFWVDMSLKPVADETGWYRYWVSVQRDVTDRRGEQTMLAEKLDVLSRAQERLVRERAEIAGVAAVAENAQELITVTDTEFRILWANRSFLNHTEYELADIVGRAHCDLLNKQSSRYSSREMAQKAIIEGSFRDSETLNTTFSGKRYWCDTRVSVERDERFRPVRFIIVERDITEERAMREELRRHRDNLQEMVDERTRIISKQAEELAKALEAQRALNEQQIQFVRMASHEFRTPISVIAMAVRRARKAMAAGDAEDHAKRLDAIESQLARLGKLIDSTLNLAKADAGKLEFAPEPLAFADYMALKIDQCADASDRHRIDYRAEGLDGVTVEADPAMLDHIFENLISNARKYSPGADVVEVRATLDDGAVRVDVRDFGVGIPQDDLGKLFQRYFRASTSSGIAGTGIGLSVVKEFVAMHGGAVSVESRVGEGTTFTVRLPAAAAEERRGAA